MARRRIAWGDGFITERNGKYQARWKDGAMWRAKTFATEDEAADHLHDVSRAKRTGRYSSPSTLTVSELVTAWLERGSGRWKSSTVATYKQRAERHITPHLGVLRIDALTTARVQDWIDDLRRAGLDPSTIDCASRVLSGAYKDAVRLGLVPTNPVVGVRKPAIAQKPIPTWTAAEIAKVMAALRDEPFWFALYQFALSTGVRPGELRALRWQDVNLDKGTATIARTMTRDADGLVVMGRTTKTGKPRTVAIPAVTAASLKRWQIAQKERRLAAASWHDDDLVFDRGDGRWLPLTTWQKKHRRLIAATGVKAITFHQLRHTAATLMLERGIHPKVVSEILGHQKIETTLNLYQHVSVELQRAAVEAMANALFDTTTSTAN